MNEYKMTYDYHTHTTFSHGKGSIEDNVRAARERGLSAVAISDHGPGHLTYGVKRRDFPKMRKEIERLKPLYPEVDIFLSVEANIANTENGLDITNDEFDLFDFVIAGYHYGIIGAFSAQNFMAAHAPAYSKRGLERLREKNTEIAVRALENNRIRILTHPGDKGPFDIEELARVCAARGTLMEISTWHDHLTVEEIKVAADSDVRFVISSDAHVSRRVGSFQGGIKRALEAGIDIDRIDNIVVI